MTSKWSNRIQSEFTNENQNEESSREKEELCRSFVFQRDKKNLFRFVLFIEDKQNIEISLFFLSFLNDEYFEFVFGINTWNDRTSLTNKIQSFRTDKNVIETFDRWKTKRPFPTLVWPDEKTLIKVSFSFSQW